MYQLILWKQCHALVQSRGFPAQLEVRPHWFNLTLRCRLTIKVQHVVRDLWALRLETYLNKIQDSSDGGEIEFFSSQPTADQEEPDIVKFGGKHLQWPRLVDSVALCYLGALLMRLPVGIGDFHR